MPMSIAATAMMYEPIVNPPETSLRKADHQIASERLRRNARNAATLNNIQGRQSPGKATAALEETGGKIVAVVSAEYGGLSSRPYCRRGPFVGFVAL